MRARILIVDDNTSLAGNLRDVLEGARELDVEVALAPTGKQGLASARRDGFDVAVVDVKLPDASGLELIAPLRSAAPHGEIVLVTGFATVDTAMAALRAGAFAFILKSFRPEELISTVAQAIEKISLKREREELERRYRAIIDAADVLILGLNAEGRVALFNPRLSVLTGVGRDAAVGMPFCESLVDESEQRRFNQSFQGVVEGDAAAEVEVGVRDAVGAIRRVRWHLSGVRSRGRCGRTDLVYGIGIDVTERRALERRAADAEALNAMVPLALGLAHEIRNPLNAAVLELHLLSRSIDRLSDEAIREPMKRRVGIVEAEIARLGRLLGEFLELARPRAPHREPVDLARVVRDVLDLEEEALASHRVEVVRDLSDDCFALGDVEKLKQVVLNLVVNALDVMPEGGVLRASASGDVQEVWLSIADTGPGIAPTILAEIFDPFFTTKAAGTGLGLAIVRKIVDQHAGRVEVNTRAGEGTTVRVRLPRFTAEPVSRPVSSPPRSTGH
ncbi:sensor histidine kinase [Sorangium cellulosum]|uniref:histidine kinase n=1 Tax=Sorangium cellulosum TaxID=56 RepID=A0A2L0ENM4_SORCE|nr:ATP-binding protein [Sorangium cellulosum]AUX40903.1 sensor histidine kinase [Sorangium cellulosum]